jgi:hypothetical protein
MCGQEGYFGTSSFKLLVDMDKMSEIKPEEEEEQEEEYTDQDMLKELDETHEHGECSSNNIKIESMVSNLKAIKMSKNDDYDIDF